MLDKRVGNIVKFKPPKMMLFGKYEITPALRLKVIGYIVSIFAGAVTIKIT